MVATRRLRQLIPALLGAGLIFASAAPAAAKMPYFSVELDPAQPAAGELITVTVRTWADAEHSQQYGFTYEGPLTEVVEFQRRGEGTGVPALVPVPLRMVEADLFRGAVTLPVGEWRLWAFPHGRGADSDYGPGYPSPIDVVVRQDAGFGGWAVPVTLGGALAAAVVVVIAFATRWQTMRVPRARVTPRPTSMP